MSNLKDAELVELNEIIKQTLNALIDCADKHNIDRDSFVQYFGAVFGVMAEVSTFKSYKKDGADNE